MESVNPDQTPTYHSTVWRLIITPGLPNFVISLVEHLDTDSGVPFEYPEPPDLPTQAYYKRVERGIIAGTPEQRIVISRLAHVVMSIQTAQDLADEAFANADFDLNRVE